MQTQSYGPEARGGASKAEVIVSSEPIDYPEVQHPDVSLVLSQAAYDKYAADTRPGGLLDLRLRAGRARPATTSPSSAAACRSRRSPTDELGKKVVTNIVAVGALVAVSGVLPVDAVARRGR